MPKPTKRRLTGGKTTRKPRSNRKRGTGSPFHPPKPKTPRKVPGSR